jgi:hypothetical protein
MNEPWFDPNTWAWLPGTLFGGLGGLWGALGGTLAPRGKARPFILGYGRLLLALSVAFLAAALLALRSGQPYGIWYGLGLPGVLGVVVLGPLFPLVAYRYRQAEERKMAAEDLRA